MRHRKSCARLCHAADHYAFHQRPRTPGCAPTPPNIIIIIIIASNDHQGCSAARLRDKPHAFQPADPVSRAASAAHARGRATHIRMQRFFFFPLTDAPGVSCGDKREGRHKHSETGSAEDTPPSHGGRCGQGHAARRADALAVTARVGRSPPLPFCALAAPAVCVREKHRAES